MSKETITSRQNTLYKDIISLEKSKERKAKNQFVIEGFKEINLALSGGYEIIKIIHPEDIDAAIINQKIFEGIELVSFSRSLFDDICFRKGIPNLIAIAKTKIHNILEFDVSAYSIIIVLESIEKPGNIGAILRTADASGADMVILCDIATDLYNPNIIRNSIGCVFTKKIALMSSQDAKDFLIREKFNIFTTYLHTENEYFVEDFKKKTAIVFGTEATGVSSIWLTNEIKKIKIPMLGVIDSMNVSNSVAVIQYEILRQRTNVK